MIKIHKVLVEAVVNALEQIFKDGKQADKVIERTLKANPKWGSRDRAFIAENTYEIVRWWRLINYCGNNEETYINKGSLWHLFGVWQVLKGVEIPAWPEVQHVNPRVVAKRKAEIQAEINISQSYPDWLSNLIKEELPETWERELQALNQPADLIIRVNTLKAAIEDVKSELDKLEVKYEPIPQLPHAIRIKKRVNLFSTELFKKGWIEVQDASSQLVAPFLNVAPGMHVIDACAGAGGKTLHLSALMQNKGRIISMDTEAWKLEELKRRAKRAGAQNIETRLIETDTIKKLYNTADRILLDVPCSGLGVIKRNPDSKWKLKAAFLDEIRVTQQNIITEYVKMLKPGGFMVYATCSILPSENLNQVHTFLANNSEFELVKHESISPAQTGFDGFFMALIKRK